MEITSFVLGMLTIVAAFISASIVAGMVKINQLTRKTESLQQLCAAIEGDFKREIENIYNNMSREDESIRRAIEDTNREVWKQFETCGRDVSMVEKTIINQIDQTRQEWDRAIDEAHRAMAEISHSDRRYIDSRIDKVVMKGTFDGSKQIING
jgi:outer membrane murein-binding lipoprotein Lpp